MFEAIHPQKGPFLRELQEGQRFIGFYVLRSKQLEPFRDRSRGQYLTLMLSDRSGQMLARVWEGAEELEGELRAGEVVKLDGETETYMDRLQIRTLRIRMAGEGDYDMGDMLPSSEGKAEDMLAALQEHLAQVSEANLRALLAIFFSDEDFLTKFAQAPAARRVHHAYLGGLLEHTLELLAITQTVIQTYPQINADLLITGVLLHDIGKVREFSWGVDIDYSDEGRLLGHIVIAEEMVNAALAQLPDFPPELALRLHHMLVAQHGRHEWGSPRRPMTLEAIALHHIENLGAQVNRFHLLLEERPPGEAWTAYDRMLGRRLYASSDDEDEHTKAGGRSD